MHDLREKAYYPFVLDTKPGFLLSWVLYRLFNRVQFDENMIEDLKRMYREGSVVYEQFLGEVKTAMVLKTWIDEISEDQIIEKRGG